MKITIESIRDAIEAKYAPVTIEGEGFSLTLLPLLTLPAARRDLFLRIATRLDSARKGDETSADDISEAMTALKEMLRAVAREPERVQVLFDVLGDNLAVAQEIIGIYNAATQPGEASPSGS